MEIYHLKNDIKVFCTTAKSFPHGIQEAFMKLHQMLSKERRTFYGISYYNQEGGITYKAAVSEEYDGEAEELGFESYTIPKGEYLVKTISNWMQNVALIGESFKTLLNDERTDSKANCIEWYQSDKELVCMVKLKDHQKNL